MGISLEKGSRISLEKEAGKTLTRIAMGLGWDPVRSLFGPSRAIDLDASCVMLDANKNVVDIVYFGQKRSRDGSVNHSGDNLTGQGDGDDEVITVTLDAVPTDVTSLVFTVNSYSGQNFSSIANAFCRIVDQTTNAEVARYDLSAKGDHTGLIMARLYRHNNEWKMHAMGETASQGRIARDIVPNIQALV